MVMVPRFSPCVDYDASGHSVRQKILHALNGRRKFPGRKSWRGGRRRACPLGQMLGGEFFATRTEAPWRMIMSARSFLFLVGLDGKENLGVADRNGALLERALDVAVQIEQAHGIGDGGPAFADPLGNIILGKAEVADAGARRPWLLQWD